MEGPICLSVVLQSLAPSPIISNNLIVEPRFLYYPMGSARITYQWKAHWIMSHAFFRSFLQEVVKWGNLIKCLFFKTSNNIFLWALIFFLHFSSLFRTTQSVCDGHRIQIGSIPVGSRNRLILFHICAFRFNIHV